MFCFVLFFFFFFFFHWKDQHFRKLMAPSESWGKTASKTHVKSFENIYCNVENHQRPKWTVFSQHCLGDEHEMSQIQKQNLKSHYKSSETNHHILIGFRLCSIIYIQNLLPRTWKIPTSLWLYIHDSIKPLLQLTY